MLNIFSCVCWPCLSLEKCLFRSSVHFKQKVWVVCFFDIELHELYVYFGYYPLSVASFAIISSHTEGCLFMLFMVSFALQKALGLNKSHVFYFCFYFH